MHMENTVYHVYHSKEVIAHSLSEDELDRKILEKEIKKEYEILKLTTDDFRWETEQSY